jgi:pimeloyl-ACP methyl ester carboxylesterase
VIRPHEFVHNGLTLRSMIHIPDDAWPARRPVVVFVHGFTSNRIEVPSFVGMSRLLADSGIASVRFDLSGHGESDGDFFDVTITGEIAETKAVVRTVRTMDFVDPERLALVGMSMGGVVAGIAAAELPGIRALCLWSPAAVAPFDVRAGYIQSRPLEVEFERQGYFDAGGHRMSPALARDIAGLDVYGRSARYFGPVRIIHGDADDVAPLLYARRYLDHYSGPAELEVVPDADHGWSTVPHRNRLHRSTLEFLATHLRAGDAQPAAWS